jgi:predicted alpha-1,2-mannosidase
MKYLKRAFSFNSCNFFILTTVLYLLFLVAFNACNTEENTNSNALNPVDYVNPYMGNISHLLVPTFPTVHLPHSILRVYPNRGDYTTDLLDGFPIVVASHRKGTVFKVSPFQGNEENIKPVIKYSYDNEEITPYSYSVNLDEQKTEVEFSVSHQSALYQFTFEQNSSPYIILNSAEGELNWDGKAISGYQHIEKGTNAYIYFEPELTPESVSILVDDKIRNEQNISGENISIILKFNKKDAILRARYGISFIDTEQAEKNVQREIKDYNITSLKSKGREIWNEALGKIAVKGGSENDNFVFYTSLYRTLERPVVISEDGRYYSAYDRKIHSDNGTPFYTDDWIWDSYRAHHPLNVLINPKKEEAILHSLITMSEQMENYWMPTFPRITGDHRGMNSNHGVASVIDAHYKGLSGFSLEKAYKACKGAITEKTLSPWSAKPAGKLDDYYKEHGYLPALKEGEVETVPEVHFFERRQTVAVTLGTAYDEWCLSEIAKEIGKADEQKHFLQRSFNYRNLFNAETGFFHPKDDEGKFIEPFDYIFSGGQGARAYYDENNAWIYRWDVQHNVADLIDLMGGNDKFVKNLDAMFAEPLGKSKYEFYKQLPDHTGNVGQFSMANEPSLHIPYLYNYAGQPWKTQKRIRSLVKQWFRNDLMGVPGDEDGGGMSAFVVFSSMGFYPVTPGNPAYNIGSPFFEHIKVDLGNGKFFEVEATNCSEKNKYIQSATLNGKIWDKPWFNHADIINGGKLVLSMGSKANPDWGSGIDAAPPSVGIHK